MLKPIVGLVAVATLFFLSDVGSAVASPLAYITNSSDGTISILDTDTNTLATTVTSTSLFPAHVALNTAGTRAYITSLNSAPPSIRVLDTVTNTYLTSVNVPALSGGFFTNLIVSPTQPFAYLGVVPDKIYPLDLATNVLAAPITVPVTGGDEIRAIALDPTGSTFYATKSPSAEISVIDVGSGLETDTIPGGGLGAVIVDPAGAFVYAVRETLAFARNEIVKSSTTSNTVVDNEDYVAACTGMAALAIEATGTTLYASCAGTNTTAVIDTSTLTQTPVTVGFVPTGISLTPDDAFLYVANQGNDNVSVIDTSSNTVVDTIPVGDSPIALGDFIGPDYICGNGTLEPGEGCDDGNILDGDGCNSTCYSVRDAVVSSVKPVKLTIPSGDTMASKTLKAKVRNTDAEDRSILIIANTTTCTGAFGEADFGAGVHTAVTIPAGKTAKGEVKVTALANSMFQLNLEAPIRCTFTVTAYADPSQFTVETNPSNNVATFEVDIVDEAQLEQTTVHETTISAAKPLKMKIKAGGASAAKKTKFKAGNADYLPTPEAAASHTISITALDGDCPLTTAGTATIGGGATADVEGAADAKGEVTMTVPAAGVVSPSKISPARCVATVTAVGPAGDSMANNSTTTVVIDIVDENDF